MTSSVPSQLQAYSAALEHPAKDEPETEKSLTETMLEIGHKTYKDSHHAIRTVHAKSHGLLKAKFEVLPNLPEPLAQGLFATPHTYDAIMRISTIPGDILDDNVSTPRGLAVKVLGVDGEHAEESREHHTQDFVTVNGKQFNSPSAKAFLANLKLLAATTDRIPGTKKVVSTALQQVEKVVEAFGGKSATLVSLGGHPETHILGESFFSQVPVRYGNYVAKLSIRPVSPSLKALTDAPVDLKGKPDGLREAVVDYFESEGGEWELCVQLCTDAEVMSIEDPSVVWDEEVSPFIPVARITAAPQVAWSHTRSSAVDDGMGFSPWHCLEAHRPLGNIMRMRRMAYDRSQAFRSERNQRPVTEPDSIDAVPDL
ncbi:catalase family protein [Rhizobium sp. CFBP 8762]|uniref:catalase family protein n=1 Tax=Rhizobium sp. CFBP 8762 TaxID=2775279 RepID=UPI00177BEA4C|nr:catalase family protein [Rhizobium sp. CFBP 8762]MBD8553135.1 catalase family protein [Rhizobium sp. CFBP 8762]